MKKLIIGFIGLIGLITVGAYGADWSNPLPSGAGQSAGQWVQNHENIFNNDIYTATTGKLNMLKSSFAGAAGPAGPNTGQVWYNTTNKWFEIYDASWGGGGMYSSGTSSLYNLSTLGTLTAGTAVVTTATIATETTTTANITTANITTGNITTANLTTVNKTGTGVVSNWTANYLYDGSTGRSASATAAANKIPVAGAGGTLNLDWLPATLTGKDCDTLDGFNTSTGGAASSIPVLNSGGSLNLSADGAGNGRVIFSVTGGKVWSWYPYSTAGFGLFNTTDNTWPIRVLDGTLTGIKSYGYTIWHSGNDGTGSTLDADTVDGVHTAVISIGDWNMDSTASVSVVHGLTLSQIRGVNVVINIDAGGIYDLISGNATAIAGSWSVGTTSVVLSRVTGGFFDSASFDSTSYNRGFITITHD